MELFLGNRKEIGVELNVTGRETHGTLMGYAKIWFGGNFLGSYHDYIYLDGYLLGGLSEMLKVGELNATNFPKDVVSQFHYFESRSNDLHDSEISGYLVSFGTLTDSFTKWVFKEGANITILWKLENTQSSYEDLKTYPSDIFKYTISFDRLEEFVERLDRILKNW